MTGPETKNIFWLGHSSFRWEGSRTVYFDPWEVSGPSADLILITHDHFDHCDPATVKALSGPETRILCDAASVAKLKEAGIKTAISSLALGDEAEVLKIKIKTLPAYNLNKEFHPKSKNNLGFLVTMDELTIYMAGDADFIPEMAGLMPDIALLPVSGTYVMTAEEAVQAALALKPHLAIPMHYGKIVGDEAMAALFAERLAGKIPVEIKSVSK